MKHMKKIISMILILIVLFNITNIQVRASVGDGTIDNPYNLNEIKDILPFSFEVGFYSKINTVNNINYKQKTLYVSLSSYSGKGAYYYIYDDENNQLASAGPSSGTVHVGANIEMDRTYRASIGTQGNIYFRFDTPDTIPQIQLDIPLIINITKRPNSINMHITNNNMDDATFIIEYGDKSKSIHVNMDETVGLTIDNLTPNTNYDFTYYFVPDDITYYSNSELGNVNITTPEYDNILNKVAETETYSGPIRAITVLNESIFITGNALNTIHEYSIKNSTLKKMFSQPSILSTYGQKLTTNNDNYIYIASRGMLAKLDIITGDVLQQRTIQSDNAPTTYNLDYSELHNRVIMSGMFTMFNAINGDDIFSSFSTPGASVSHYVAGSATYGDYYVMASNRNGSIQKRSIIDNTELCSVDSDTPSYVSFGLVMDEFWIYRYYQNNIRVYNNINCSYSTSYNLPDNIGKMILDDNYIYVSTGGYVKVYPKDNRTELLYQTEYYGAIADFYVDDNYIYIGGNGTDSTNNNVSIYEHPNPIFYDVNVKIEDEIINTYNLRSIDLIPEQTIPFKEFHTFDGWFIEGTDTQWDFDTGYPSDDTTLEARFTEIPEVFYDITYLSQGETWFTETTSSRGYLTQPQRPPAPSEFFKFDGWYYEGTDEQLNFNVHPDDDYIIEARFSEIVPISQHIDNWLHSSRLDVPISRTIISLVFLAGVTLLFSILGASKVPILMINVVLILLLASFGFIPLWIVLMVGMGIILTGILIINGGGYRV